MGSESEAQTVFGFRCEKKDAIRHEQHRLGGAVTSVHWSSRVRQERITTTQKGSITSVQVSWPFESQKYRRKWVQDGTSMCKYLFCFFGVGHVTCPIFGTSSRVRVEAMRRSDVRCGGQVWGGAQSDPVEPGPEQSPFPS